MPVEHSLARSDDGADADVKSVPSRVKNPLVPHTQWLAHPDHLKVSDMIKIQNLEATPNAGVDVWGRKKQQRALITVTLSLNRSFDSAAEKDALDASTIHYGTTSKAIRSMVEQTSSTWISTVGLACLIDQAAVHVATRGLLQATEVEVFYLKGSMHGDGAGLIQSVSDELTSRVLFLRNVRIPCVIGINDNERLKQQPVVANLWINCLPEDRSDDFPKLEDALVEVISGSKYETLETLSAVAVQHLRETVFTRPEDQDVIIRLRVEKPLAVPFADAPAIEIIRPVRRV